MRTVSFSNAQVQEVLNRDFACSYRNIKGEPTSGESFKHSPNDPPGPCGRGAGRQNVQTVFMTPDNKIFHVMTGFLSTEDLLSELNYAQNLFAKMERRPSSAQEAIVDSHATRLKRLGFSSREIESSGNQLSNMMMGGLNPQDLGINMPGVSNLFMGDISRKRILRDHQFTMNQPLLSLERFEQNPGSLVGNHKTFFGTNAAMGGAIDQMNRQMNR